MVGKSTKRLTHEYVAGKLAEHGYKLTSKYKNTATPLHFECPVGHRYFITWGNFTHGNRCAVCAGRAVTAEHVAEKFKSNGYKLLTPYDRTKGNKAKLEYICPVGHRHYTSWNQFDKGTRCPYCAGKKVDADQAIEEFKLAGFNPLGPYVRCGDGIECICAVGHKCIISRDAIKRGRTCPDCSEHGYKPEIPGTLYYIRFESKGKSFYKIGITNLSPKERFLSEKTPHTVLMEKRFLFGFLAYQEEQRLLKKYKKYQYKGAPILRDGNTELFTKDVLGMDKAG